MDFTSLNLWLWVAAAILAVLYGIAGFTKATQPIAKLAAQMKWPGDVPVAMTRFVGISEVAGAVGLILPLATGVLAWLTPLAALGLTVIQILAIGFHAMRREFQIVPFNIVLLALSVFVLWGRRSLLGL